MGKGLKKKNLTEEELAKKALEKKNLIRGASEKVLSVQVSFPVNNGRRFINGIRCSEPGQEFEPFFQIALEALKKQEELYAYHVERGLCPHCSEPVSPARLSHNRPALFCCDNHGNNYAGKGRAKIYWTPGETPDFCAMLTTRKAKLQSAVLKIEIPDFAEERKIVTVFLGEEKIEYYEKSELEKQWDWAWEHKTNGGELEAISDFKKEVEFGEVFFTLESYLLEEELRKMTRIDWGKGKIGIVDAIKACFLKNALLPIKEIAKTEAESRQKEHEKIDAEIAERARVAGRKELIEPLLEEEDETAAAEVAYRAAIEAEKMKGKRAVPVGRVVV